MEYLPDALNGSQSLFQPDHDQKPKLTEFLSRDNVQYRELMLSDWFFSHLKLSPDLQHLHVP
jgi:hypothetical protein